LRSYDSQKLQDLKLGDQFLRVFLKNDPSQTVATAPVHAQNLPETAPHIWLTLSQISTKSAELLPNT